MFSKRAEFTAKFVISCIFGTKINTHYSNYENNKIFSLEMMDINNKFCVWLCLVKCALVKVVLGKTTSNSVM